MENNKGQIKNIIDLKKAEKEFMDYVASYDIKDSKIRLKVGHIKRVEEEAKRLAQSLEMSEEQAELAALIGLLHDIGRFEQIKQYHTFSDNKSVDHAEYGIKVLFEDGLIRKFIKEDKYDEIIKKAILNHNKYQIESGLSDEELLHAKIIRDADKIDILYTVKTEPFTTLYETEDISKETLSDDVYQDIMQGRIANYQKAKTHIDNWVTMVAFSYDLYFPYSFQAIKNDVFECLHRIDYQNIETKEKIANIEGTLESYFKEHESN